MLILFKILGKTMKLTLFVIISISILICIGIFIFLDDIKQKTSYEYEGYREKQIYATIPQECNRVGIDSRVCNIYMERLINLMRGKNSGLYTEKTWNNYLFEQEPKTSLAKQALAILKAEGKDFIISQARIDRNMCNALSSVFNDINPNEFACKDSQPTMKELGGFIYDLKYLILLFSGFLR